MNDNPLTLSRRALLGAAAAFASSAFLPAEAATPVRLDRAFDEAWFIKSSFDLSKDFAAVTKARKSFAIIWELNGCPWCKVLHTVNFRRDDIRDLAQNGFGFLQLDIRGGRQFTDFDGDKLPEESLSLKYSVNSTPTVQFFAQSEGAAPMELGRAGYLEPDKFLLMLQFVRDKGYEDGTFDSWARLHHKES